MKRKKNVRKGLIVSTICLLMLVTIPINVSDNVTESIDNEKTIFPRFNPRGDNDTTPPVTTIYFDPPEPDGGCGWYVSNVTITLEATDDMSGIYVTYYSINSEPWKVYDEPILLHEDGLYYIVYFSVDNVGNMEFPKLSHLKIDHTPIEAYVEWDGGKWYVRFTIIIEHICGMDRIEMYINDRLYDIIMGPGPNYEFVIRWSKLLKSATFRFRVYDSAGWYVDLLVNGSDIKSHLAVKVVFWDQKITLIKIPSILLTDPFDEIKKAFSLLFHLNY